MYKMIFIDMDGTLLDSNSEISEDNRKAISYAHEKGVRVVLCSGRSYFDLVKYAKDLGIYDHNCYISSFNGAVIIEGDGNRELHATMIPLARFRNILEKMQELGNDYVIYPSSEVGYVEKSMDSVEVGYYFEKSSMSYEIKNSLLEEVEGDIFKIVAVGEMDHLKRLADHMRPHLADDINMFYSGPRYLEFTPKEGTKGHAVKYLATHFGVDTKEIMAIGDNGNDESMIKEAGLGVAMKNGVESLKQIADVISDKTNDEGGVADIIYKYIH